MKKTLAFAMLVLFLICMLASCGNANKRGLKIGMVVYSDERDSYVASHVDSISKAAHDLKISDKNLLIKRSVAVDDCYSTIGELLDEKCNLIFSVGAGFEDYMVQSATENSDVQYCVCYGTQAATAEIPNLHSYSTREFESRYIAGVLAGLKLNDMIENGEISPALARIGYVGGVKGAENISAYTAFYLGAKSVCSDVVMQVQYSGTNHDKELERVAVNALIANGNKLIAQQSYLNGAAETCEENGKYFIGCIAPATDVAENCAIASVSFDWTDSYKIPMQSMITGETIPTEWSKGISDSDGFVTEINKAAFSSDEALEKAKEETQTAAQALIDGSLHVFDTSLFTVHGEQIISTLMQNDAEKNPEKEERSVLGFSTDVEYISSEGYFAENELSSLPRFEILIDGIEVLN